MAMPAGTGVTRPTHRLARRGVSTGTARMTRGQARHGGVALHHLAVGQHIWAADVEGAAHVGRHRGRTDEVAQHVAHRDGLDAVVDPARRDHGGQPLREVAHHLEGRAARPEDDGRLEHRGRHAAGQEDVTDLPARLEVRGERLVGRVQAAEVDDAPHPGLAGGDGEPPRGGAVALLKVGPLPRAWIR